MSFPPQGSNITTLSRLEIDELNAKTTPVAADEFPLYDSEAGDTKKMVHSDLLGTLTGDMDFANFIAIALSCDNGDTMPESPSTGQWFLHTPTGRKILYQYNGSDWIPVISLGTMTVYVDSTDGTDDLNHGTGVDSDAFKTIQYAIDTIPGIYGGDVSIYVNDETYDESLVVVGKHPIANYTISIYGTLSQQATGTIESAVQGTGATQGSITDTGQFGSYDNLLLYANEEYRLIDSDTADIATICGCFTGVPSGSWIIYDWATKVTGTISLQVDSKQTALHVYDIHLDGSSNDFHGTNGSNVYFHRCSFDGYAGFGVHTHCTFERCYFAEVSSQPYATTFALMTLYGCKIDNTGDQLRGIWLNGSAHLIMQQGCVLDGHSKANSYGIMSIGNSFAALNSAAADGYNRIRNWDTGVYAKQGGQISGTANVQYAGNNSNENAVAASFGFID